MKLYLFLQQVKIKIVNKNSPKIANKAKLDMEKHQTHYKSVKTEREEKVTTE